MFLTLSVFVIGLLLLVKSADAFVDGASSIARYLGMSPFLVGMIIVGFGTSAPELLVSSIAAWQNSSQLALGNVYGSNIVNMGLILSVAALINPIVVHSKVLKRELPILVGTIILVAGLSFDGMLSRLDAGVMLLSFLLLMTLFIRQDSQASRDTLLDESKKEYQTPKLSKKKAVIFLVMGLVGLLVSSKMLVWGAIEIAKVFGVSDLMIGLTIVAIGTSLPELAACVGAALKKEHDIALGNVIGSNLFNILAVLGVSGCIRPLVVSHEIMTRDISVMMVMTLLLWAFCYSWQGRPGRINRLKAVILILVYVAYTAYLCLAKA